MTEHFDLNLFEKETLQAVSDCFNSSDLQLLHNKVLGKKSYLSQRIKNIKNLSDEQKRELGQNINKAKSTLEQAFKQRLIALQRQEVRQRFTAEHLDVTLPISEPLDKLGRLHPLTKVWQEFVDISNSLGFATAEGPDIETDELNFTALNFKTHHPARDSHDTFYLPSPGGAKKKLLRSHTSPVQMRIMREQSPPIRVVCPGRVYRSDYDQTHTPMFHQLEGLVVDKGCTIGHLRWVVETFLRMFFDEPKLRIRFRPSFFPFTEPSMEIDVACYVKDNQLIIDKQDGDNWMEILGCGMVHRNVLHNAGIDSSLYQGFAWGLGLDRLTMLKYGIPDLRTMFEGGIRWTRHYGFHTLD